MKYGKPLLSFLLLLCAAAAQAQMYKWVGPDGKVTYSDAPPPATVKQVETKSLSAGGPSTVGLPYELAEAVKNSPVRIYTTTKCGGCDEGHKLLNARGIPFTEKTVSSAADSEELRKASGSTDLPFLQVGRNKQTGFEPGQWNSLLSSAGYPASSQLPKNYRNTVEAAAPVAKSADNQTKNNDAATQPTDNAPSLPAAPSGFRF